MTTTKVLHKTSVFSTLHLNIIDHRVLPGKIMILISLLILPVLTFSQKENKLLRHGNKNYENDDYKDAEMDYRKALEINNDSKRGQFNLGTAVYKQKNWDESVKIFGALQDQTSIRPLKPTPYITWVIHWSNQNSTTKGSRRTKML